MIATLFACSGSEGQLHSQGLPGTPGEDDTHTPRPEQLIGRPSITSPWPGAPEEVDGPPDGDALYADGAVHDIHIRLSDSDVSSLRSAPTTEVSAGLDMGSGEMEVALRLKGNSSFRSIDDKPSFKIDVHQYVLDQRIDGEKRLTLHNMIQDQTMLREHSYYWLARRFGVPAARYVYARVWVNDEPYGLYGLVETMDEELVERAFKDDEEGNLYESSGADFTSSRDWFELEETGDIVPTPDDIEELVDAAEGARDSGVWAFLQARFDVSALLGYWAVDIVTGNDDGYVYNRHNYLAYHAPLSARWSLLPWGTDRSFTRDVPPRGDSRTPLLGALVIRCWDDDQCAAALTTRIEEVLVAWENALPAEIEATYARIEADCEADTRKEYACKPEHILEFVQTRAAFIRDHL
ncbi:MAG: CotH kinase family protein [Pseudomonadota bacterium]|nr:CotH kinase family protein [Pseudomonadota bacterium]